MSHPSAQHTAPRMRIALGIATTALLTVSAVLAAPQPATAALNPNIIITESDGSTNIHPGGPTTDSYTIRLATTTKGRTWFTITPTSPLPFAEVSIDGGVSWGLGKMVLTIPAGDMSAHTVMVRWAYPELTPDDFPSDSCMMTIFHPADSLDPDYESSEGAEVCVRKPVPVIPPGPTPREPVPSPQALIDLSVQVAPKPPVKIDTAR